MVITTYEKSTQLTMIITEKASYNQHVNLSNTKMRAL